jgi:hypothetical protein
MDTVLSVLGLIALAVVSIRITFWIADRPTLVAIKEGRIKTSYWEVDHLTISNTNKENKSMYAEGYKDGSNGKPPRAHLAWNADYRAGYDSGKTDAADANEAAQDFVDGYRRGEAGDEFDVALLESGAYRAGFRDGEAMNGMAA